MFKIEKTRPPEADAWQDLERDGAIAKARAALQVPGDTVTVTDSSSGETLWMGVFGRDGRRHEWSSQEPQQVQISPAFAVAA
ncbi:MAG: hypothetical protein A2W21_14725 [Betaproteobacteria bacterium RBG_16_66_20]|nr:MAG: hypothetical protein A2W21_14725 [Betaproteobacteria bacterium RBG_16_66_20]